MQPETEDTPLLPRHRQGEKHVNDVATSPNNLGRSMRNAIANSMTEFTVSIRQHMGRIGALGSLSIAVNSLTGPAMLNLPDTFHRSGLIPTTLTVLFVCLLSAMCCLHMANTISKVPGNSDFKREIEYSDTFKNFWGQKSFVFTQVLFFCCVTCLNISSIVDTAQVIDTFLGHWYYKGSSAINIYFADSFSPTFRWVNWDYSVCSQAMLLEGKCLPFLETEGVVLTAGYLIMLLIFVPMALMDLKENAAWQTLGFLVLVLASIEFVILFLMEGINFENVSLWGERWDSLFGVVLFNFALVIVVPAWLYEKDPGIDVPTIVHSSSVLSAMFYILIGGLGAACIPHVSPNMLESMMSGVFGTAMQLNASIFAFFIVGLGCPLFSVLARMNLTGSGLLSHSHGNIFAVYLPFFSSWLFYQGDAITELLSWGGIIFTSLVAFILPLWVSLHALHTSDETGVVAVYGQSHELSKPVQRRLLQILLVLAALSIFAALMGNFF